MQYNQQNTQIEDEYKLAESSLIYKKKPIRKQSKARERHLIMNNSNNIQQTQRSNEQYDSTNSIRNSQRQRIPNFIEMKRKHSQGPQTRIINGSLQSQGIENKSSFSSAQLDYQQYQQQCKPNDQHRFASRLKQHKKQLSNKMEYRQLSNINCQPTSLLRNESQFNTPQLPKISSNYFDQQLLQTDSSIISGTNLPSKNMSPSPTQKYSKYSNSTNYQNTSKISNTPVSQSQLSAIRSKIFQENNVKYNKVSTLGNDLERKNVFPYRQQSSLNKKTILSEESLTGFKLAVNAHLTNQKKRSRSWKSLHNEKKDTTHSSYKKPSPLRHLTEQDYFDFEVLTKDQNTVSLLKKKIEWMNQFDSIQNPEEKKILFKNLVVQNHPDKNPFNIEASETLFTFLMDNKDYLLK